MVSQLSVLGFPVLYLHFLLEPRLGSQHKPHRKQERRKVYKGQHLVRSKFNWILIQGQYTLVRQETEREREGGREREKLYLSSQSDDTGEVAPVLGHTLEVAEHTLELGSLRCHSPLTAYIHTQK